MPIPAAPLITGGASIIGQGINAISQGAQNRASRKFSREMYDRQYQDNLAFWRMQNEYNAPSAQMKRLQEAGLNPNLMFGKGGAISGNAGPVKTPDVQSAQFRAPQFDLGGAALTALNAMYDFDIKQAQVDNLKADNTIKLEQSALLNAQRHNVEAGTRRSVFDLDLDSELRSISADARRENLRQLKIRNAVTLRQDERAAIAQTYSLRESAERVLNMRLGRARTRQEIKNMKLGAANLRRTGILQQLDIDLKQMGVNPADPMWSRILGRILSDFVPTPGDSKKALPGGNMLSKMLYGMFGNK